MKSKSLGERFMNPTVRDVAVALLCVVMIYLLRARDTYRLIPRWRQDIGPSSFANKKFPDQDEHLPQPIITDIESDGNTEIVLVTNRNQLLILECPNSTESVVLPRPIIKQKTDLTLPYRDDGGRSVPVAMSTGFLVPYQSMVQVRKQVIVIATDDWYVLCYDHELNLLWTTRVMNIGQIREHYVVKSLSILVTAIKLHKKDDGLIIIGGSYEHKLHRKQNWKDISALNEDDTENHKGEDHSLTHFSTFALSGTNGTVRWHHLPGEFGEQQTLDKDIEAAHHWKLALRRGHLHKGELPWTLYKDDILDLLPHKWETMEDTRFHLAHIEKSHTSRKSDDDAYTSPLTNLVGSLDAEHIMGYAYGGMRPHSAHEHIKNPNTVVIHNQNGIEVLNLMNGQPVTKIKFPEGKSLFADTDGDGIIEEVFVKLPQVLTEGCDATVSKYEQSSAVVFSHPLCESAETFVTRSLFGRTKLVEDRTHLVAPMVVKSVAKKTGIAGMLHHLSGEGLRSKKKIWDLLFVTSSGVVRSFGTRGENHWETQISSIWSNIYSVIKEISTRDSTMIKKYKNYFRPTVKPISLQIFGEKDAALIVGWDEVTLLDLHDGYILGTQRLPCQTHSPLVTGDFYKDGWTDFIYTCPIGYIGFSIEKEPNYTYNACIATAVVLVVLILTWCCSAEEKDIEE